MPTRAVATLVLLTLAASFPAVGADPLPKFDIKRASSGTIDNARFDYSLSEAKLAGQLHYRQPLRPQFHYTPIQGHIGDATGLIEYQGQYHLFYMFDHGELRRDKHKRWGHAVSSDLIHWKQLPAILDTQRDHHPGSGCGVVDWGNTSGLRQGSEETLMVFYTDYALGTCMAFSRDAGQTWAYFDKNPVLADAQEKRDPLIFWHQPTGKWCMIRYENRGFAFYHSSDLIRWTYLSRSEGYYECPDLLELPVENKPGQTHWVLIDGDGTYFLGRFDGNSFTRESERLKVSYGEIYATQTWRKPKTSSGRPIQVAWTTYPNNEWTQSLTWNGQLSFPCELRLCEVDGQVRLHREPIQALGKLYDGRRVVLHDVAATGASNPLKDCSLETCEVILAIKSVDGDGFRLTLGPATIHYDASKRTIECLGKKAVLPGTGKGLHLRVLVDRSSLDLFADHGLVALTRVCFPLGSDDKNMAVVPCAGGRVTVETLEVNYLKSMWVKGDADSPAVP